LTTQVVSKYAIDTVLLAEERQLLEHIATLTGKWKQKLEYGGADSNVIQISVAEVLRNRRRGGWLLRKRPRQWGCRKNQPARSLWRRHDPRSRQAIVEAAEEDPMPVIASTTSQTFQSTRPRGARRGSQCGLCQLWDVGARRRGRRPDSDLRWPRCCARLERRGWRGKKLLALLV
jgi:hypothetical protein